MALIDGLPPHSRYIQAMHEDEEFMEMIKNQQGDNGEPIDYAPPLAYWSPEVDMGANILDALNVLTATTVAVNGGKAKKPKPTKRPLTSNAKQTKLTEEQETLIDLFGSIPTEE